MLAFEANWPFIAAAKWVHSVMIVVPHKSRLQDLSRCSLQEACLNRFGSSPCCRRLRWFGHVNESTRWINRITLLQVDGSVKRGRPHKTWAKSVNDSMRLCGLKAEDALDRVKRWATIRCLTHKCKMDNGYWMIDWLADLNYWVTDWFFYWLTGWLIDWLTDWLIYWLTDWLTDWLIDWLID